MLALTLVVELILYVAVGFFLQKRHMVGKDFDRQLSVVYTDIFLPCLIFDSFQLSFDPSDLKNCAVLLALSAGYFLVSALAGQLAFRLLKGDFGRIVRFGLIFTLWRPSSAPTPSSTLWCFSFPCVLCSTPPPKPCSPRGPTSL